MWGRRTALKKPKLPITAVMGSFPYIPDARIFKDFFFIASGFILVWVGFFSGLLPVYITSLCKLGRQKILW